MTSMPPPTDLAGLDAAAMTRAYAAGLCDPVDVLEATLARIARLDPVLNAFVARNGQAQEEAAASAARYKAGAPLGPLDGVPIALKDNLVAAGLPATWGSRLFAGDPATHDELPVHRVRSAGAVLVGKTNTPEFAVEGFTGNSLFGVTGNPWDPALTPGGSSGGSVAAVAARMLPLAFGTDGGGSIRRPAAYTGLVGLKPTLGRVPRHGGLPQVLLDFEVFGAVARTVGDVAAAFEVLAGPDRRDPASRTDAPTKLLAPGALPRLRIVVVERFGTDPCDPVIRATTRAFADRLADLGHDVQAGELPVSIDALGDMWSGIAAIGLARLVEVRPEMRTLASQKYLDMAKAGAAFSATHLAAVLDVIRRMRSETSQCFETVDVILTPACAAMPWPAGETHPPTIDGQPVGPRGSAIYTGWVNAAGHPAIAVPSQPHADGMPIGVQLIGDLFSEPQLLALAAEVEQAEPWAQRLPALVARDVATFTSRQ